MRGFEIFRIAGIRILIDPSWVFIFALVTWSLAAGYFPFVVPGLSAGGAWVLGAVSALLLFGSVLVHELSHALLARRSGLEVPRIRLFLFGGVSEMASEPRDPRSEMKIAAAGPLTSLALAAAFALLAASRLPAAIPGGMAVAGYLATVNLVLGVFNLLPGFPLDGGRILRAWLWKRRGDMLAATRTAGRAGSMLAFALMALGVWQLLTGAFLSGIWSILIGMFLHQAASASYQTALLGNMMSGVAVRDRMHGDVFTVPEDASVGEAVEYFLRNPHGSLPVVSDGGALSGMVSLNRIRDIPRAAWNSVPVRKIMTPLSALRVLDPDDDLFAALESMIRSDASRLPVVRGGALVGILSERDILKVLQLRSEQRTPARMRPAA